MRFGDSQFAMVEGDDLWSLGAENDYPRHARTVSLVPAYMYHAWLPHLRDSASPSAQYAAELPSAPRWRPEATSRLLFASCRSQAFFRIL